MRPRPAILFTAGVLGRSRDRPSAFRGTDLALRVLAIGAARVGGRWVWLAGGSGLLAGRLSGELAVALERDQCAARLPAGRLRLRVRVLEPVDAAGGRITLGRRRRVPRAAVSARWPRGRAVPSRCPSRRSTAAGCRDRDSAAGRAGRWWSREADRHRAAPVSRTGSTTISTRRATGSTAPGRHGGRARFWVAGAASTPSFRIGSRGRAWCTCSPSPGFTSG